MADETTRSPAPDAAPEDNPEPDALKDADITSGTGDPDEAKPEQSGEAGPASGTHLKRPAASDLSAHRLLPGRLTC